MAENADDNHESIETDAAPSVFYVNLPDLDIGSEIVVESEQPKQGDANANKTLNIVEEKLVEGTEVCDGCDENGTGVDKLEIEPGLKSLNLGDLVFDREVNDDQAGIVPFSDDNNVSLLSVLEQQDSDGDTLLHIAIICLDKSACVIVQIIGDLGGSLNIQNNLLQTPLHLAVITRQENVVRKLLLAGASRSCRDNELQTPMHIACKKGNYAMLETLLHHGSWSDVISGLIFPMHPLNMPNADGERCLHLAVKANDVAMAGLLVSNGADVNMPDRKSGQTPLHVAANLGLVEMVNYLVSVPDIDINQRNYNDETAIDVAYSRDRFEVVEVLQVFQ